MNPPRHPGIWKVALPVPLPELFDYLPPAGSEGCPPGARVIVPFGRRRLLGVVAACAEASELPRERLARVIAMPDEGLQLIDPKLLGLLLWCAQYYKHAPGEVVLSALPPALRSPRTSLPGPPVEYRITGSGEEKLAGLSRRAPLQSAILGVLGSGPRGRDALAELGPSWRQALARLLELGWVAGQPPPRQQAEPTAGPRLTAEQAAAVGDLASRLRDFHCHLLDGVTGSGKTEVYMCLIEEVLGRGRQAMVLVPEIGLTPQLVQRFRRRLGLEPALMHSRLSAGQRLAAWDSVRSGRSLLLIGTRSALFTPVPDLGLIVLDEEHDASFKQQEGFRYSARDVAVKRAADLGIPIVLGSATPSLETLRNAAEGRYGWSRLRRRATQASLPEWRVLDLRHHALDHGVAEAALAEAGAALGRGEQVMVFLNRRGYAPVLMCGRCGWQADCQRCDAHLTWHRSPSALCCHHCGSQRAVPALCPECGADALEGIGEGTQQLEEMLGRRFGGVEVLRFDADRTSRKGVMDEQLVQVREGGPCVLVGTQMLAKGHHFPGVTLVIVVGIDQALYSADYRALERMGQLLQQVAGRAGREDRPGTVMLQTLHPDHEALALLLSKGYEAYASWLLEERRNADLPPFSFQALLRSDAHRRGEVRAFLEAALRCFPSGAARAFGPLPAIMERRGGRIRMYLIVTCNSRAALHRQLDAWLPLLRKLPEARKVRWSIDVDPQEL